MNGYRQSGYDPEAGFEKPRPRKPYDKWQWLGIGAMAASASLLIVPDFFDFGSGWRLRGSSAFAIFLGGMLLIRYRREPTTNEPQPETSERRRRIGGLILIAIGLADIAYKIFVSQGAN